MSQLPRQILAAAGEPYKLDCVLFNEQTPGRQVSGPLRSRSPGAATVSGGGLLRRDTRPRRGSHKGTGLGVRLADPKSDTLYFF